VDSLPKSVDLIRGSVATTLFYIHQMNWNRYQDRHGDNIEALHNALYKFKTYLPTYLLMPLLQAKNVENA